MLNIISRSIVSTHTRGPRKVVINLLKGLDEMGYPYIVNGALDSTKTLWIHDDPEALGAAMNLPADVAILTGPNIYTLPSEIPSNIDTTRITWLHPSDWVQDFWTTFSSTSIQSAVWPTGVDTKLFTPLLGNKKNVTIVYNKNRSQNEINAVCKALEERQEPYKVLTYGNYQEADYYLLLGRAKAIIWIGRSESQGIGLLEALAMDVPALVWDVVKFGEWTGTGKDKFTQNQLSFSPVTSAPYFDESCGMKFTGVNELITTLPQFFSRLSDFEPREYVENNLSLPRQAAALLDIFKIQNNQDEQSLRNTEVGNTKKWKNGTTFFKLKVRLKDALRQIIR